MSWQFYAIIIREPLKKCHTIYVSFKQLILLVKKLYFYLTHFIYWYSRRAYKYNDIRNSDKIHIPRRQCSVSNYHRSVYGKKPYYQCTVLPCCHCPVINALLSLPCYQCPVVNALLSIPCYGCELIIADHSITNT